MGHDNTHNREVKAYISDIIVRDVNQEKNYDF